MQKSTDMWFRYLNERHTLTEGLRDIGLPEYVIDYIEGAMPESPEKSKVVMGNLWKNGREYSAALKHLQFDIVNNMINEYSEYVYPDGQKDDEGRSSDVGVRTVEPYDLNSGKLAMNRVTYDEEKIEQGKRVKFVIQNIKNGVAKPFGTWRKMLMKSVKALSKAGVPSEKVETTKEDLNNMLQSRFRNWWNQYDLIAAFLNDDPVNYELAKDAVQHDSGKFDADELLTIATQYLENKEDPDFVLHTFDDGSYWYDLQTSNCSVEGERMGHCGSDSRGTLVSLRKKKSNRRESSSYVTMTWAYETLYQIKGRSNDAPPDEMWPHIAWFINNMDIDNVEETGEHSNDYDGFVEMNEWLSRNTSASFHGNIEELIEHTQEHVEAIDERFYDNREEAENTSISCTVESGEDMGGDPRTIYLYMSGDVNFQINLGWPGFETRDGMYRPMTGPDSGEPLEFEDIPVNTWGSEARQFESDLGLDDLSYDLPGEDGEVEWEVTMMTGFDPNWETGEPEPPQTAHLVINIRDSHTGTSDGDDEASEYNDYADNMLEFDANHEDHQEKIRRALVSEGYISKTAYDRAEADLIEMQLENFKVYSDESGVEFWFKPPGVEFNLIKSDITIPTIVKQYLGDWKVFPPAMANLFQDMFGGTVGRYRAHGGAMSISTDHLNSRMASHIQSANRKREQPTDGRQLSMAFGQKYRAPDPRLVLAKDSRFVIVPEVRHSQQYRQRYPDMNISWKYTIGVSHKSPDGEVEVVKEIVEFLDKNPELVFDAANEIIEYSLEPLVDRAEKKREQILSNREFVKARETIRSTHGANADTGNPEAEKVILMLSWFDANYNKMSEVQRYVMWKYWLEPLTTGTFRLFGEDSGIELDDEANIGKPRTFEDKVYAQAQKLGAATQAQAQSAARVDQPARGTVGEPRPAGEPSHFDAYGDDVRESMEDQIARIESLLNEADSTYDLRIYNIQVGCTVNKDVGGSESETATEIRGITRVTTVRPVAAKKRNVTPTAEYVLYDIKFELLGAQSRVEYRDQVLLPALRMIKGLKVLTVSSMHRTNKQGTIRTVRESKVMKEYGGTISQFGGLAGSLGSQRTNTGNRRQTPRPLIQSMIDDWAEGAVMAYDAPAHSTDMRYHTMLPVEDLLAYIGREYRGDMNDFRGRYQNFIKNGATHPVYLAIGQNGRAKVTGSEDLIWFAKKSGLKELPVFLSFQKQV